VLASERRRALRNLYTKLIAIRHAHPAFSVDGEWQDLLNGGSIAVHGVRQRMELASHWGGVWWRRE
jgi:hypothetical protein